MRSVATAVGGLALAATLVAFHPAQREAQGRTEQAYRANNAGVAALERFDYPTAATHFRQALSIDPATVFARLNLAIALHYAGDSDAARKEALAAAEQLPREPRAWFVAGLASRSAGDNASAISALERVLQLDQSDAATLTVLGQLYMEAGRPSDAVAQLTAATKAEPFNATATYSLARALIQAGRAIQGKEAMNRFQSLRDAPYAVTYSATYLQQGKLGEALLSTGSEPNLVDPAVPAVFFTDVTTAAVGDSFPGGAQSITLADIDADRDFDLVSAGTFGVRLFEREVDAWKLSPSLTSSTPAHGVMVADYDNDGRTDVLATGVRGVMLWHQLAGGRFEEVTSRAFVKPATGARTAAFVDIDHDGDLDLVSVPAAPVKSLEAWRNNGNGSFVRFEASTGLVAAPEGAAAIVATDFDNRRDVDLLIAGSGGLVQLKNIRDGRFEDAAASAGLRAGSYQALAAGDLNADGRSDFFVGRAAAAGVIFMSDTASVFRAADAPDTTSGARAAQLLDYDSDGVLDLVTLGDRGLRVFRNTGSAWVDVSKNTRMPDEPCSESCALASRCCHASRGKRCLSKRGTVRAAVSSPSADRHARRAGSRQSGGRPWPRRRALVSEVDRRAPADFPPERFRGYAADHYVGLFIPERRTTRLVLLLTVWTDYAFSSDNVAASQAGLSLRPPSLEIKGGDGRWRMLQAEVGIPVGRPPTVVVDLTGRTPRHALRLRVRTNMRVYWDQILFDVSSGESTTRTRLPVDEADLRWRGYSVETTPDGREPYSYDYDRMLLTAPWKLMPGRYTREGHVRELVSATDDRFVVSRPGDEIAISFRALPAPPAGWTRTFLLHADGFSKEMDRNSASPDVADPLPYHGMKSYPADPLSKRMTAAQRTYVERYNTRVVTRPIPSLIAPATETPKVPR